MKDQLNKLQIKKVGGIVYVDTILPTNHIKRLFKCNQYYVYDNEIYFYVDEFRIAILYVNDYSVVNFK